MPGMRHTPLAFATLPLLVLALGCGDDDEPSACDTTTDTRADPDADFTAFSTFAVADPSDYPVPPPDFPEDIEKNFEAATDAASAELEQLGLTQVDESEAPDLLLFTAAASEINNGIVWECVPGWYWWGWNYVWDPCAWLAPVPVTYSVGTAVVGLAEPDSEQVVFGGIIQGVLDCGNVEQRLTDAMSDVFAEYPADQTGN